MYEYIKYVSYLSSGPNFVLQYDMSSDSASVSDLDKLLFYSSLVRILTIDCSRGPTNMSLMSFELDVYLFIINLSIDSDLNDVQTAESSGLSISCLRILSSFWSISSDVKLTIDSSSIVMPSIAMSSSLDIYIISLYLDKFL